eukprot:UN25904
MAVNEDHKYKQLDSTKTSDYSNAQDLTAFHIISEDTVDGLGFGMSMDSEDHLRFRPNILVKNCGFAFSEDFWTQFQIGKYTGLFHLIKLCNRCT